MAETRHPATERPTDTRFHANTADETAMRNSGDDNAAVTTASGINLLLGLWLIVAPWVLDYSSQNNAVWNQVVIGIVIATLALIRVVAPDRMASLSWVNAVLGAWLIIAPFVLTYNDTGHEAAILWNDVVVGVLVLALAVWSALATSRSTRH